MFFLWKSKQGIQEFLEILNTVDADNENKSNDKYYFPSGGFWREYNAWISKAEQKITELVYGLIFSFLALCLGTYAIFVAFSSYSSVVLFMTAIVYWVSCLMAVRQYFADKKKLNVILDNIKDNKPQYLYDDHYKVLHQKVFSAFEIFGINTFEDLGNIPKKEKENLYNLIKLT